MKKVINTEMSETMKSIMVEAWSFVKKNGYTISEALHVAWTNFKLRKALRKGVVEFYFKKVDGSIRQAFGTLKPGEIPTTNGTRHQYTGTQVYYDTEKADWRCYKTCNLLRIA